MKNDDVPDFGRPDELPEDAAEFWPDLRRWPTHQDVDRFTRGTRREPTKRLAVLSGLRSWSTVDLTPLWAWAGSMIALVAVGSSIVVGINVLWIQVVSISVVLIGGCGGLTFLAMLQGKTDLRRRRALVWLRAFEEALGR